MEFKLPGFKSGFIFIRCSSTLYSLTSDDMNNILDVVQKYKMSAEDVNKFPYIEAIEFKEELGTDDDYVFLIDDYYADRLDGEAKKAYIDEWFKCVKACLLETSKEEHPVLICSNNCSMKRIKKVLLPFM